jgi:NAD(P)-dependent dehydrogenase (short-subunit alcohol dehydrogenase family)
MVQRTALVTGGNRGLGFAVCRALAQRGPSVVLTAREENEGRKAEAELGTEGLDVAYYPLDVSHPHAVTNCQRLSRYDRCSCQQRGNLSGRRCNGNRPNGTRSDLGRQWPRSLAAVPSLRSRHAPPPLRGHCQRLVGRRVVAEGPAAGHAAYAVTNEALNALTVCLACSLAGDIKVKLCAPAGCARAWVAQRRPDRRRPPRKQPCGLPRCRATGSFATASPFNGDAAARLPARSERRGNGRTRSETQPAQVPAYLGGRVHRGNYW